MNQSPFPENPVLTAIAVGHMNRSYIADAVLPRASVSDESFKYTVYNSGDAYNTENTKVGRTGEANQVEFGATDKTESTEDHGLKALIPQKDIDKARLNPGFDPRQNATVKLTNKVLLAREIRAAALVMDIANYGTSEVISGTDQWTHADSDPIEQLFDAMQSSIVPITDMTMGKMEMAALRKNAAMIKAFNGSLGDTGLVPIEFIRELLGLERIHIGTALQNTANKGQDLSLSGLWGGGVSLTHQMPLSDLREELTWGATAQYGGRVARNWVNEDVGLKGGETLLVGEQVKELVIAKDAGHFLASVI